jgi:hypothetical protein
MNVSDFTHLLQYPDQVVSAEQTRQLEDVLEEYPYFQAARALHLKGLHNLNSFKYNNALKITAAHTADRDILFDFITSASFLQNSIADTISGKGSSLNDQEIISEEVKPDPELAARMIEESEDSPLPRSAKDADAILDPALFASKDPEVDKSLARARDKAAKELEIGKPLNFSKQEKFSFGEWLQLTSLKTVRRVSETEAPQGQQDKPGEGGDSGRKPSRKRNFELIDKFIEANPKLVPGEEKGAKIDIKASLKFDKNELMTETLAKVYLEQKKYKKAIQAYKILSLKYPEKSGFFADRIKAVIELQKEK